MGSYTRHLGLGLLILGCGTAPAPVPPPPAPVPVPPPEPVGPPCELACVRMRELGCEEGQPTPKGDSCEEWLCAAVEAAIVDLKPACLATIADCSEINGRCR